MSAPTVTITLKPQVVDVTARADLVAGLHMLYVQAVKGDVRHQWVVFPPPVLALDVKVERGTEGQMLVLERVQEFAGNRSKWFHRKFQVVQTTSRLSDELAKLAGDGFKVGPSVAVPLEEDDYKEAWTGTTPHKALRAVDRALRPYKITVKGTD